jgi:hypothetical protein
VGYYFRTKIVASLKFDAARRGLISPLDGRSTVSPTAATSLSDPFHAFFAVLAQKKNTGEIS